MAAIITNAESKAGLYRLEASIRWLADAIRKEVCESAASASRYGSCFGGKTISSRTEHSDGGLFQRFLVWCET